VPRKFPINISNFPHEHTQHASSNQWNLVFWFSSGMFLFGFTAFALFASAEPQPWAVEALRERRDSIKVIQQNGAATKGILVNGTPGGPNAAVAGGSGGTGSPPTRSIAFHGIVPDRKESSESGAS
jgi:hypothetical protein